MAAVIARPTLLTIEYKEWETAQALAGLALRIAALLFVLGEEFGHPPSSLGKKQLGLHHHFHISVPVEALAAVWRVPGVSPAGNSLR